MSTELEQFAEYMEKKVKDTELYLEKIKNLDFPMKHEQYDRSFDGIIGAKNSFEQTKQQLHEIDELITRYGELLDIFNKELNNNKFKFGLQGQLKRQIKSQQDVTSLPPHIQDIVNSPIVPTPFENRGGKKRKSRKNRRTRK